MAKTKIDVMSPEYKKTWRYDLKRHKVIYLMFLAVFIYYFIFHYIPMFGIVIGFQKYRPAKGILNSDWVGLKNFIKFFTGPYAFRLIRNTIVLNLLLLCFSFTAPIIFALMLNEMKPGKYKSLMQTISYMPHFISAVVVCGLLLMFTQSTGVITAIFSALGLSDKSFLLSRAEYFRPLYVIQDIWQELGWGSIIYLATVSNVDMSLYEAAEIDGAGRFRKIWSITIPALIPVIVVQLIMRIGSLMSLGSGKVILLYSPSTYETADVISSYVYRAGLLNQDYSLGTAVDLCNSVVNIALLFLANTASRRLTEQSLW
ncbi:MAG: ABC transporter permease [Candidatus Faecivicinus sp.]